MFIVSKFRGAGGRTLQSKTTFPIPFRKLYMLYKLRNDRYSGIKFSELIYERFNHSQPSISSFREIDDVSECRDAVTSYNYYYDDRLLLKNSKNDFIHE